MTTPLRGLIAATFTPLHADRSLALDRIPTVVDHLVDDGVDGLFVLGSTGEGVSFTTEERRQVTEAYVQAADGRLPVIVQVGHNSLKEARQLAQHAARVGADALSAVPPSYFCPKTPDEVVDCLSVIAKGAPDLPLYYYHIPALTGVDVDVAELLQQGVERIPSLTGVKFSDSRLHALRRCKRVTRSDSTPFEVFFGVDEMLLDGLMAGADGAVGSTYNFAAPLYRRLLDAFENGDRKEARHLQERAITMVDAIIGSCGRAGLKATMQVIGVNCGPNRLPLKSAGDAEVEALREALSRVGFFEWGRLAEPA